MNEDIEFLNLIYKNAKMGIIGINNIKDDIEDKKLLKTINEQKNDYCDICSKAIKLLSLTNGSEEDISQMAELMTYMDAKMKLMKDNSTSNIAKIMIEGSNMGIVKLTKQINNYSGDNKKIVKLANHLLEIEERNLENLKKYL